MPWSAWKSTNGFDGRTSCVEPGSLQVTYCSSLYFSNAGFSLETSEGSWSEVRVLMSSTTLESSPGGAPSTNEEAISIVEGMVPQLKSRSDNFVYGGIKVGGASEQA